MGSSAPRRNVIRRVSGTALIMARPIGKNGPVSLTDLPESREMHATIRQVTNHADAVLTWNYERERAQLVTLYDKGVTSQWNGATDLDWSIDVDPEELVRTQQSPTDALVRAAADLPGSPLATWGEREFTALGIEMFKASLSQFMHGEQGAMITAAKLVESVPWIDAKYYAATQTIDEARHTEVFARVPAREARRGVPDEPVPRRRRSTALLEDSRWDIAYLGMQIVIESLALAAFGDMLRRIQEPLLRKLLRYVMSDEARHVAFGVLSLQELYAGLTEAELKDRQEFLVENTLRSRARSTTPEVWERMGVGVDAVRPYLLEAAAKLDTSQYRGFQGAFFAKLVPNVRKLGLLDANDGYLREQWGEAGLLEFEFADDTGSDYASYDAVAARPRRSDRHCANGARAMRAPPPSSAWPTRPRRRASSTSTVARSRSRWCSKRARRRRSHARRRRRGVPLAVVDDVRRVPRRAPPVHRLARTPAGRASRCTREHAAAAIAAGLCDVVVGVYADTPRSDRATRPHPGRPADGGPEPDARVGGPVRPPPADGAVRTRGQPAHGGVRHHVGAARRRSR